MLLTSGFTHSRTVADTLRLAVSATCSARSPRNCLVTGPPPVLPHRDPNWPGPSWPGPSSSPSAASPGSRLPLTWRSGLIIPAVGGVAVGHVHLGDALEGWDHDPARPRRRAGIRTPNSARHRSSIRHRQRRRAGHPRGCERSADQHAGIDRRRLDRPSIRQHGTDVLVPNRSAPHHPALGGHGRGAVEIAYGPSRWRLRGPSAPVQAERIELDDPQQSGNVHPASAGDGHVTEAGVSSCGAIARRRQESCGSTSPVSSEKAMIPSGSSPSWT